MATTSFSHQLVFADDAAFRTWGSTISATFASLGFIQTADTGQINWSTATKPGTGGQKSGYEVWRFNDALQATAPLFFRIDYGTGGNATNAGMYWNVGKGSNGSGTLTGSLMSEVSVMAAVASPSGAQPSYACSSDGSTLWFGTNLGGTYPFFAMIERSRAANGTATSTGAMFIAQSSVNGPTGLVGMHLASTGRLTLSSWPAQPTTAVAMAVGGKAPVFAAVMADGQGNFWQPRCAVVGNTTDLGSGVPITVPGFGTYLPFAGMPKWSGDGLSVTIAALVWS